MSYINIMLRGLSILIKFSSLAYISKGLLAQELDVYFLLVTIAAIISQVFGLQTFHVVNKLYNKGGDKAIIDTQLYQYIITFIMLLMLLIIFFNRLNEYSQGYILVLFLLVVSEILTTEFSRVFIVLGQSLYSNLLALFNSVNYLSFGMLINFYPSVFSGLNSWSVTLFLMISSCFVLLYLVLKNKKVVVFSSRISCKKIVSLVRQSWPYLLSQILNLFIVYFARFLIESQNIVGLLSNFSILHAFANIVAIFISVGIIAPLSPKYLSSESVSLKYLFNTSFCFSILMSIGIFCSFEIISVLLSKPDLIDFRIDFLFLLLGTIFFSLSQVYQLFFLKHEFDRLNLVSYLITAVFSLILNLLLISKFLMLGASIAYFASGFVLFIIRAGFYFIYRKLA